jgi:uncharacterized membrane protein YoaK (UPF0700 family)
MMRNTTNLILSFLDSISKGEPLAKEARQRFKRTVAALTGFFVGCLAGGLALSWLGDWA